MSALLVFLIFLGVRLFSVFYVKTFFVPDEYWQSVEVAHKFAFGYGHLTWEWAQGIRSYIYPLVFAGFFKILALLSIDTVELVVLGPRILQALLSAYADYRFYVWTNKKKWSVFLVVASYFWFYTGSRTLVNTLEASLTTIALSMFPWSSERTSFLWLTAICCYIRPTAVLTWLPLCIHHLKNTKHPAWEVILKRYLVIGSIVFAICAGIDSYAHGEFLITPWRFFEFNILHDVGSYYGVHPWYWYFTIGLPTVLGVTGFPFLFGIVNTVLHPKVYPTRKWLLISILLTLAGLSVIPHKEFRFVLILLPMCLYICSDYLSRWSYKANSLLVWLTAAIILLGNALPAWYISTLHQKGTLELMPHLAELADTYKDENGNSARILLFMPCHSTPFYSHVHKNITMNFVQCEPDRPNDYTLFQTTPDLWLRRNIPAFPRSAVPTHIVFYDDLRTRIQTFLSNYHKILEIRHTDYTAPNTGKNILVYEIDMIAEFEKIPFDEIIDDRSAADDQEYADERDGSL